MKENANAMLMNESKINSYELFDCHQIILCWKWMMRRSLMRKGISVSDTAIKGNNLLKWNMLPNAITPMRMI